MERDEGFCIGFRSPKGKLTTIQTSKSIFG